MEKKPTILIVGAGIAGTSLAKELESEGREVVGFVDDQATGKTILGTFAQVSQVIAEHHITAVYFAIPSADPSLVREIYNNIHDQNLEVAIVPHTANVLRKATAGISDLRKLDISMLLGRAPRKRDVQDQLKLLRGKRVLITGAAGSIGSELAQQIAALAEGGEVIAVDWWENGIYDLQYRLREFANVNYEICNIQDYSHLEQLFEKYKPQFVFHAAAYKHVPLMENNPLEAFNNNVGGTYNLMEIAGKHKVEKFTYISTDKAVNPTNVMGSTKRIGEWVMKQMSVDFPQTEYSAVRFGNVLGSNGSVVPLFQRQIADGGPVTITHREVTRFFMTIPEAVSLVISTVALPGQGCIYVLDMGEQMKVIDLAEVMIKYSGKEVEMKEIGLRPGEKMYEELSYDPEKMTKTDKDLIYLSEQNGHEEFADELRIALEALAQTRIFSLTPIGLKEILAQKLGFAVKVV